MLAAFEARAPRPWLALGHSMGGGLTALALAEGETRFAAAVLSAPMVSLNLGGIPLLAGRAIAFVLSGLGFASRYVVGPGDPLGGRFKTNVLTHDRARWTRNVALFEAHPALRLGNVTWAWLTFALSIPGRLAAVTRLSTPMTVVLAAEERLIDNQAARDFAARVGAKLVEVPGARHEIMMETDERRALFWAAFDARVETI